MSLNKCIKKLKPFYGTDRNYKYTFWKPGAWSDRFSFGKKTNIDYTIWMQNMHRWRRTGHNNNSVDRISDDPTADVWVYTDYMFSGRRNE